MDLLTVREHLELYCGIKCLDYSIREMVINNKIKELNLQRYENVTSGTLSGGNKRKLSTALATLANPKVIFLDEPSTGMDPEARRFMWDLISRISTKQK